MSLITGIIFTVVIFGTFGFLIWSGKRRVSKVKKTLQNIVKFHKLDLSSEEVWNDKALGLDKVSRKLVFVDCSDSNQKSGIIPLLGCVSLQKEVNEKEYVKLTFDYQNRREVLVLFTIEKDDPVEFGFHVLLANKWLQLIQEAVPKPKRTRKTKKVA